MIRFALIGAGRWGRNIIRTLDGIKGCHLKYICDPSAEQHGVLRDHTTLLKQGDINGIIIATPGSTHAGAALPFIEHGTPTFIEKPMTTSLHDAHTLERAARKSGAIVFVGHLHLYNPAYLKSKALTKKAGRIRLLRFESMNNGPYRDDMSALWDWAPHDVAMALDLLGSKPISVQAWGENILRPGTKLHDAATIKLVFPSPPLQGSPRRTQAKTIPAFMALSWLSPEKRKKLTILGTKDIIVFDDTLEKRKVTLYQNMGPEVRSLAKTKIPRVIPHEPTISHPPYSTTSPLKAELEAFLTVIKTGKQPLTDIKNGVEVTRIIDAAERSMALNGTPVTILP